MQSIQKAAVDFILKNQICNTRLDMDDLKRLCRVLEYDLFTYQQGEEIIEAYDLLDFEKRDAFSIALEDKKIVLYNETIAYCDKLFAILHEIGHIVLSHSNCLVLGENEDPIVSAEQEGEANEFAYAILAPLCVLKKCGATTKQDIEYLTLQGEKHVSYILKNVKAYKISGRDKPLLRQYQSFILEQRHNKRHALNPASIIAASLTLILIIGGVFGLAVMSRYNSLSAMTTPTPNQTGETIPALTSTPEPTAIAAVDPTPVSTPSTSSFEAPMVYVTPSGSKYHLADCYHTRGSQLRELTIADAEAEGYTYCKDCRPDFYK